MSQDVKRALSDNDDHLQAEEGECEPPASKKAYIVPAKKAAASINDPSDCGFQKQNWEDLKKSINGLINKVNVSNIADIAVLLFGQNLIRGRAVLVKSVLRAQTASNQFTNIYAALIAVINSKLPEIGSLLTRHLIQQFHRALKRQDKLLLVGACRFLAHLVNQQVAHEVVILQILATLLQNQSNEDAVEVAVLLMKECGSSLTEKSPKATIATFDRFRKILQEEQQLARRVQYLIEDLFKVRKNGFSQFPARIEDLDLVEDEDQTTHSLGLDNAGDLEEKLAVFQYDDQWSENEQKYNQIRVGILGEDDAENEENGSDVAANQFADSDKPEFPPGVDEEDDDADQFIPPPTNTAEDNVVIQDKTESEVIALRRKVYLTIMSSLDFQEACHKLLKLKMPDNQLLVSMVIECCSQERTYEKYYGLISERLCKVDTRKWPALFSHEFETIYQTVHRYETNRVRNMAKLYAHLLYTDAIPWIVLKCIRLGETTTTSSSRIFLKFLFQELVGEVGKDKLRIRLLEDSRMANSFDGLFPMDVPRDVRFAINYWTSIDLGVLTDAMREYLNCLPEGEGDEDSDSLLDSDSSQSEDELQQ